MGKKIIWIEDDIGIIKPVIRPLINDGHKIVTYSYVAEALKNMDELKSADLLLVDMIHPPGENNIENFSRYPGLDFLEQIRNQYKLKTPVVVLTVVTNADVLQRLKKLNVADIINKPVRPSVLKEKIERALGI